MSNITIAWSADLVNRFGVADYLVFGLMLLISAAIGIYFAIVGGKQKTTSEFLMGGRTMGVFPVALSIFSSFISAIALLGMPAEIYQYGLQMWVNVFFLPIVMFCTIYFFIPVFYELGLTSAYEYLELRFDRPCRVLASFLFCCNMLFYMSVVLYAPALALSQVTGMSVWFSVLSTGLVCTFYTTIGGLKAVVWTDVFQSLVMLSTCFIVLVKGFVDLGGPAEVWEINKKYGRTEIFDMDPDPLLRFTFWTVAIGQTIKWTSVYGINQAMVQRYLSVPTMRDAKRTLWTVLPLKIIILTMTSAGGLVTFAKYYNCDPILTQRVKAPDQIYPLFVTDSFSTVPGFTGLFVAGVFSGSLSTISSGVNSLAAVTLEDFVKTYLVKDISDKTATVISKSLAFFYGLLSLCLVFVAKEMGNILPAVMKVSGLFGSPIFGLFILGMFFPTANKKGAFFGTLIGIGVNLWIGVGALIYKPYYVRKPISVEACLDLYTNVTGKEYDESTFIEYYASPTRLAQNHDILSVYRMSFMYYAITGTLIPIIVGYIITYFTGPNDYRKMDLRLLTPLVRRRVERELKPKKDENSNTVEMVKTEPIIDESKVTTVDSGLKTEELGGKHILI